MTSWDTLQNVGSCVECYVKYIPATDILQNDPEVFRDFPLPVDRVDDISRRTVKPLAYPMKLSDLVLVEGQKNLCYHNSLVE
jgi:hypothetical protein